MTYKEIAQLEGIQACQKALVAAFKMESYGCCVATLKPLLTEVQKQIRLVQAIKYLSWTLEQWTCVVWTNKCSLLTKGFRKVYVTQRLEEKYDDSYYSPKFRDYSSQTIYRSILALSKGDIVVIKKEQSSIIGEVYRERVLNQVY